MYVYVGMNVATRMFTKGWKENWDLWNSKGDRRIVFYSLYDDDDYDDDNDD